jgi:hypothetical protein
MALPGWTQGTLKMKHENIEIDVSLEIRGRGITSRPK